MSDEQQTGGGTAGTQSGSGAANNNFLATSILIAAVMVSGSILYSVGAKPNPGGQAQVNPGENAGEGGTPAAQAALLEVKGRDVILGDPNAKVTIIEYGDYQCPFCARHFTQAEPLIKENYVKTGKARLIYRNLAFLGPESVEAAEAAECAKDQQKFWAFHDALYTREAKDAIEHNGNLNKELFLAVAEEVGMDSAAFTACYDANTYAAAVQQELEEARAGEITATPMFFVNSELVRGAVPYAQFEQAIERILAQ